MTAKSHRPSAGSSASAVAVVDQWWRALDARDWPAAEAVLDPGVVVEWPVSRERMRGRENFLAVQREYPEGWSIRVLRLVGGGPAGEGGGAVASEVEVPMEGVGVFRVASFWTVRAGLVVAGTEYWTGPEADPSPSWRARWVERY
ncbi:nuclear transport factor 2 family protein [Streptomyces alkaliterrae]|uniref:nuclear transport factor 2 family protein n=1 Tax=Streptomyces alkaliterrae TaxID=2213162 RepID=UPI002B1F0BD8|nr:nuclear transport factor 2 family protein [Streptomyces alkaliterrae]